MQTSMWRERLVPYEQAVNELMVKFESIAKENRKLGNYSPIEFVTGRVKRLSSILDKAKKKRIPIDQIEDAMDDIAGIRILCQFVEDIDRVVELIRERNDMRIKSEKDYVRKTKPSGYRSYHIIVYYQVHTAVGEKTIQAEIQIRTLAMNFWATVEHSLGYKYKGNIPDSIRERLIRAAQAAHMLDEEMSKIREEVMDAQDAFQYKSTVIADILNNLENLKAVEADQEEIVSLQQEFNKLLAQGNLEYLVNFNKRLDILAEIYQAQNL